MPFPMKIQPIESYALEEPVRLQPLKPVVKSRLKRLFERQFQSVLRPSTAEKVVGAAVDSAIDSVVEFEPSSVCLDKMVQNFIQENNNEKQSGVVRCGRRCCNCFNRTCSDSSDEDLDWCGGRSGDPNGFSSAEAAETLKSLVMCSSVHERNLLADTAKIVEKNKMICKRKDGLCRKVVTDGLLALGYDASVCKSRWEKSPSYPAGEYEYIDALVQGERLIIDIDFRSEFEIARSTKTYKSVLNILPYIFVGRADRLQKIITVVSDAAKQSLKKKGMHVPPWRRADYVKAKWLSPFKRSPATGESTGTDPKPHNPPPLSPGTDPKPHNPPPLSVADYPKPIGEVKKPVELKKLVVEPKPTGELKKSVDLAGIETEFEFEESVFAFSESSGEEESVLKPPEIKPKSFKIGVEIVTGLASVIDDDEP